MLNMAFWLSVEKCVGSTWAEMQERITQRGQHSQTLENESHSTCEGESEWCLARAWGHRGVGMETAGAEGQTVKGT